MLNAFSRAIGQLLDPRIVSLLGASVLLSCACFAGAWFGIDWLLGMTFVADSWFGRSVVGWLATLALAWFLFPIVTATFVGLLLEYVARAVEHRYYPDLEPPAGQPFWSSLALSLRFFAVLLGANLLLLVLVVTAPLAYPFAYYALNGYLVGREYFELVALRRQPAGVARALRARRGTEILFAGVLVAILMTVPVVNLVMPVVATAAFVHLFERWRR